MFTYLDPTVRARLIGQGSLIRIDGDGQKLDPDEPPPSYAINMLGPIPMPLRLAGVAITVQWYATVRSTELREVEALARELRAEERQQRFASLASSMAVNSVLVIGEPGDNPLVRVHSSCLTGDVFGSQRCECGPQLARAIQRISNDPAGGYLVYMAGHEGRGIGLWAKAATYLLQDAGEDTYQANRMLGLPDDSRDFTDAAALLHHFVGNCPMRLLTNNPKKISDLAERGLTGITRIGHVCGVGEFNRRYLKAKQAWGHELQADDLD